MKKLQLPLSAFLLAVIGFFVLPSQYYSGDMVVHLQYIKEIQNPTLYTQDYTNAFMIPQKRSSVYYPLMAFITGISPLSLYTDLRVLYLFFLFMFFFGLIMIAYILSGSIWVGMLWSLLLLTQVHIGGSAIETIESDLVPRGISLGLALWSYVFILKKSRRVSFVLLLLSLAVHVLTGTYAVFFYLWNTLIGFLTKRSKIVSGLILDTVIVIYIWLTSTKQINQEWLEILRYRNAYAFYDLWPAVAWRNLGILLLPGIAGLIWFSAKQKEVKRMFLLLLSGTLVLVIAHIVFEMIYPKWWMVMLQTGRSWIYVVYAALFLGSVLLQQVFSDRYIKIVVIAGLVLVASYHIFYRSERNLTSWVEIQTWVNSHTQKECVILVPFMVPGFRVASERAIVGDMKDGTLSFYSEAFAQEWKRRYTDLYNWESLDLERIQDLQQKYGFNFLIATKPVTFALPRIFENDAYILYWIASTTSCKT